MSVIHECILSIKKFFFKKRTIYFVDGRRLKVIFIFGIPIIQYVKKDGNRVFSRTSFFKKRRPENNQRIFYLKVHRPGLLAFYCIQHWIDTIFRLNGFIYFICDNKEMEESIFSPPYQCFFYNENFKFIRSDKRTLTKYLRKLFSDTDKKSYWMRIGAAMFTPITHGYKMGYNEVYNIDADDIMLLVRPEKIAKALAMAETYAREKDLDCFNYDMFVSQSFGTHWSFGVVLNRNLGKTIKAIKENADWKHNELIIKKHNIVYADKYNYNVDWFFTFLRDTSRLNFSTFYIENATVIHMPEIIMVPWWAFAITWHNGKITMPVLKYLYKEINFDELPIFKQSVKIDVHILRGEYAVWLNQMFNCDSLFVCDMVDMAFKRGYIDEMQYQKYINGYIRPFRDDLKSKYINYKGKNRKSKIKNTCINNYEQIYTYDVHLLLNRKTIIFNYWRYRIFKNFIFRKRYTQKSRIYKEKLRRINKIQDCYKWK